MKSPVDLLHGLQQALKDGAKDNPDTRYPSADSLFRFFSDRKAIRDPVYDQILVNELERAVIRTREVQRLRWVKQMDFAYLVYPAAEHSRFVHSLGVCQSAKDLFDRVAQNFIVRSPAHAARLAAQGERDQVPDFCLFDRVLVSLAALLHDLSHPPFSHAFDVRDDMLEHDDLEHNPFCLRAFFDIHTSELAGVLQRWDSWFKILVCAEAPQRFSSDAHASEGVDNERIPSLATLVFEILAIKSNDDLAKQYSCIWHRGQREAPIAAENFDKEVSDGWTTPTLLWNVAKVSTSTLFRRLHCDIVANTISADLMDYIRRDTRAAGLPRELDRRFYSYISCAEYRKRDRVVVELEDRQGHVRRDVLSDLMNCMETRYVIHERIVLHRAVIAARSMAARLFAPTAHHTGISWETVERMYGKWGEWHSDAEVLGGKPEGVNRNIASLLRYRNLYRPIVILDSERVRRHNLTLSDEARQRLSHRFGGQSARSPEDNHWKALVDLESSVNHKVIQDQDAKTRSRIANAIGQAPATFAFCMKPSVLFKNPRILVRVPTSLTPDEPDAGESIEELESWLSQVIPLHAHEGDQALYAQIRALNIRYGELWRLYIFAHPSLFEDDVLQAVLLQLKASWEVMIAEEAAFPRMPTNVAPSELRSKDMHRALGDARLPELLVLARELFPKLELPSAFEALTQPGVNLDTTRSNLYKKRGEGLAAGQAAKGGTRLFGAEHDLQEFEKCVVH